MYTTVIFNIKHSQQAIYTCISTNSTKMQKKLKNFVKTPLILAGFLSILILNTVCQVKEK